MIRDTGKVGKNQWCFGKKVEKSAQRRARMLRVTGRCSHCKGRDLQPWGSYGRWLRFQGRDGVKQIRIRVPRLRCPHCGKTHAVMVPGIVPYRWYVQSFILAVIGRYLSGRMSVECLCERFQISISTLYHWLNMARAYLLPLCGIMAGNERLRRLANTLDSHLLNAAIIRWDLVFLENIPCSPLHT